LQDILHAASQAPARSPTELGLDHGAMPVQRSLPVGAVHNPRPLSAGSGTSAVAHSGLSTTVHGSQSAAAACLPMAVAPMVISPLVRDFLQQNVDGK